MKRTVSNANEYIPYPPVKFIVLSDIHYYDINLGITGTAFEESLCERKEIKMVIESPEILDAAIESIIQEAIDFVIVCGDLSRDGEPSSHALIVNALKRLTMKGIKVFVINGNHDIYNPYASSYQNEIRDEIAAVSPTDFEGFYSDLGYGDALDRDDSSLSYVAEPAPGLWLLAIDSCRWREKYTEGGRIYPKTLQWLERVLILARERKKAVIMMMHHGLLEHYRGNKKYYKDFIVEDNEKISSILMKYGVNIVFTGHFHCQDIALKKDSDNYLYDIETGSLVTYPCPFRIVSIDSSQTMKIRTKRVNATVNYPIGFLDYAYEQSITLAERLAIKTLRRWLVPQRDADLLAPQIVKAFTAHGTGNEEKPGEILNFKGVGLWGRIVMSVKKPLLKGLWEQSLPPDNNLDIDLKTGNYKIYALTK